MSMTDFVNISASHYIGQGKNRTVYRHPNNPDLCLKIDRSKHTNENNIDIKYHQHLQNRGASFKHIARFMGQQNTNKGNAVVFDLIKDYDGKISKTLEYYLNLKTSKPQNLKTSIKFDELIAQQLLILKQYLLTERIIFVDVSPENIVLCRINATDVTLIIIDALGSRNLIPIAHYINFFAVRMIQRRWHRTIETRYKELKPIFDTLI